MDQETKIHKVIFAGLDAAGKTSIYKKVIENMDIQNILELQPTRGIERKIHKIDDYKIVFWDLGGQQRYRSEYFQDPRVFANTSILIYVLDIQNKERFDQSVEYLLQILMTIKNLSDTPRIFVLIHKYDPDKLSLLQANMFEAATILKEANKIPSLKITKIGTSIYSNKLDSAIENILSKIIPNYTNDKLIAADNEITQSDFKTLPSQQSKTPIPSSIATEVKIDKSKITQQSEFKKELLMQFEYLSKKIKGEDEEEENKSKQKDKKEE